MAVFRGVEVSADLMKLLDHLANAPDLNKAFSQNTDKYIELMMANGLAGENTVPLDTIMSWYKTQRSG